MPQLRRRIAVAATSAALVAGPLATLAPSAASAPESAATSSARDLTLVAQCRGGRPESMIAYYSFVHRFPLPGKANWKKTPRQDQDRWCQYRNPRAKLKIRWNKGAGSWAALNQRVDRARSRPGFQLQQLHRHGARFDSHTDRTRVAEFTFRNANGKRQHVRMVGDKYTLLWVRSSQRAWRNGFGKTANRAHRGLDRTIMVAM